VGLRSLLRNLTKLVLMGLGGVLGALVVVWARANSDWATIRLPAVMVPGSSQPVEYEAMVYAVVALSFAAGVFASFWIVLAVWIRAVRRERRLASSLERLETQVAETRGFHLNQDRTLPALPKPNERRNEQAYEDFDELEQDSMHGLLSDTTQLPEGYDDNDVDEYGELNDEYDDVDGSGADEFDDDNEERMIEDTARPNEDSSSG
jgi:hypothetical protein